MEHPGHQMAKLWMMTGFPNSARSFMVNRSPVATLVMEVVIHASSGDAVSELATCGTTGSSLARHPVQRRAPMRIPIMTGSIVRL